MFRDGIIGKVAHVKLSKRWISWAYCELYRNSPLSETCENISFSVTPSSFFREVYIYLLQSFKGHSTHNCVCKRHIKHQNHLQLSNKLDVED